MTSNRTQKVHAFDLLFCSRKKQEEDKSTLIAVLQIILSCDVVLYNDCLNYTKAAVKKCTILMRFSEGVANFQPLAEIREFLVILLLFRGFQKNNFLLVGMIRPHIREFVCC